MLTRVNETLVVREKSDGSGSASELNPSGSPLSPSPSSESESSIFETRVKRSPEPKNDLTTLPQEEAQIMSDVEKKVSESAEPWEEVKKTISTRELKKEEALKLHQLTEALPQIYTKVDNPEYDEIYGHRVNVAGLEHVDIEVRNEILLKFLIAREFDVDKAQKMLIKSLNWRNEFRPLLAAFEETYDDELNELGVLTYFTDSDQKDNLKVTTWNLYGNVKNPKKLFEKFGGEENLGTATRPGSQFLRWRVGLMERATCLLDFTDASNNKGAQVHDYNNVSMFKIDKGMKIATKEIILIFGDNYPELLSIKFFLNVNILMSWIFSFFKNLGIISAETLSKFQVSHNSDIGSYFRPEKLPPQYNGNRSTLVASLFDIDYQGSKLSTYGQIITRKLNEKTIEDVNLTVD
ncbi:Non-classical phosphatidylinositol transfer protein (PITP) [Scheffersomyces spartinae]|uniref:Phosphatidylinositol transfer protein SFH5 n=1 Tax=Scheffersomyces spartinae TaxID=45513 RepID=A0A9P7V7X2_9ASCO|nr:Non-classical phosphatidylinositol transfer protein (PITP) [Scheffersomyces spartinae]KAG7192886.1 Non-classical phosphatidylinositol transfer protein (PITP) [Scheffersomyces spartinae]